MIHTSCYNLGDSSVLTKAKSPFYFLVKQYTHTIKIKKRQCRIIDKERVKESLVLLCFNSLENFLNIHPSSVIKILE